MTSHRNPGVYTSPCIQPLKKEPDISRTAALRLKLDATVAAVVAFVVLQQAMMGFSRRTRRRAAGARP